MTQSHEIRIIKDFGELKELGSEWNEMMPAKNSEPWQSFSWLEATAKAFGKNNLLRIITIRKDGRLTAMAPMVLKPSDQPLRPRRLDFLGGEELKEPNRLIASDPTELDILVDAIINESIYPIRLSRIPNDNGISGYLLSKFKKKGWIVKIKSMPYPFLDLNGTGGALIKKSLRGDLRRARKKAYKYGNVSSKVVVEITDAKLKEHLMNGFRIEASGWKGRNRTSILASKNRKEFFERYAYSALKDGILRLYFLLLDEKPIAVQYAVESARSYWLLNIGYDEGYRDCSPGNLLLEESIKAALKNKLVRYNLLGKDEPWTRRWTTTSKDCLILAAYRLNYHGFKAMISDFLYLFQRQMKNSKNRV